jgi:hypothetical protein
MNNLNPAFYNLHFQAALSLVYAAVNLLPAAACCVLSCLWLLKCWDMCLLELVAVACTWPAWGEDERPL